MDDGARAMLAATQALAKLRSQHPAFRRHDFLRGTPANGSRGKDVLWLRPDGTEMTPADWAEPQRALLAFRLDGDAVDTAEFGREVVRDSSFVVLMNGERDAAVFVLPPAWLGQAWRIVVDTSETPRLGEVRRAGNAIDVAGRSLVVFEEERALVG
jgi:glycogen operon protein